MRIAVSPTNQVLASLGVDPFDNGISGVFGTQLAAGPSADEADNVVLFENALSEYETYYRNSSLAGIWVMEGESNETTRVIEPGTGFFIVNKGASTTEVYITGTAILDDALAVPLPPSLSLVSYPFSSAMALSNMALRSTGIASSAQAAADEITEVYGYQQFWLHVPSTGGPARWLDAQSNAAEWTAQMGRGFWYNYRGTNKDGILWVEPRPYEDLFPTNDHPPMITWMTFNEMNKELTLEISSSGSGEVLEVYYKNVAPMDRFDPARGWKIAKLGLVSSGTNVMWTDDGTKGRGKVSAVFSRFYLVGRGDVDSDGDGVPDAREIFVHGTSPKEANLSSAMSESSASTSKYDVATNEFFEAPSSYPSYSMMAMAGPSIELPENVTVECGDDTSPDSTGHATGIGTCDYNVFHHFTGASSDGRQPLLDEPVVIGPYLYGMTPDGGA